MNETKDLATDKPFANSVQFQDWLVAMIDRIEVLGSQQENDPDFWTEYGAIVHTAGVHCARLGFPNLHEESIEVAPYCNSTEAAVFGYLCSENKAKTFLARCVERCAQEASSSSAERAANLERDQTPFQIGKRTAPEIAYSQHLEATYALGGDFTEDQAYAWAKSQALKEGKPIQKCETWKKHLRTAREAKGEQKNLPNQRSCIE